MSIEEEIREQYCKIFRSPDSITFKLMADFYFENAARILKKDISIRDPYKLMVRNIQKRLFIGIGAELLLKSLFLRNDFCINKVKKNKTPNSNKPTKFISIKDESILNSSDTYTLNSLIDNLPEILREKEFYEKGLKIMKVFRNKEGHVASLWHKADKENYTDIEKSLVYIYKEGFDEKLEFKISFLEGDSAEFKINGAS